jgi:hypothetical protein
MPADPASVVAGVVAALADPGDNRPAAAGQGDWCPEVVAVLGDRRKAVVVVPGDMAPVAAVLADKHRAGAVLADKHRAGAVDRVDTCQEGLAGQAGSHRAGPAGQADSRRAAMVHCGSHPAVGRRAAPWR